MNTLVVLSGLLLVGLAVADPVRTEDKIIISDFIFKGDDVIYVGENDITKIVVPFNPINFNETTDVNNFDFYIFFVEAGKGLNVLKTGEVTKLLENGKDIAASPTSTHVFFGATDGIYTFNTEKMIAEKYGTLTDNIKNILVTNETNEIYILTEGRTFYKVLEAGTEKEVVTTVKDAVQVVLDADNNLFFMDSKKDFYVKLYDSDIVTKVTGSPPNPSTAEIVRPPGGPSLGNAVPFIIGKNVYSVEKDARSELSDLVLDDKPTAICVELTLVLYLGYENKIYQIYLEKLIETLRERMTHETNLHNKTKNLKEVAKKKTFRH